MIPAKLLEQVLIAGVLLCLMSTVDTLSYGIRTAGVLTKRLAISLSLFNILVILSRTGNMIQAPVIGNIPDQAWKGHYTLPQVLLGLRIDLLFIIAGVFIGALLTPSLVQMAKRGISLMEVKGSMPATLLHGITHCWQLPHYVRAPITPALRQYFNVRTIPFTFLIWNIFVTCFYSIGVMSTILAATIDHNVASTAIMLSGIVNGIATLLLFMIVDPPSAVVIDQCITGKRKESDAKTMNVYLVITRMLGCILALVMLPLMAKYVLSVAHFIDKSFTTKVEYVGTAAHPDEDIRHEFKVENAEEGLVFTLEVQNITDEDVTLNYPTGERFDFHVLSDGVIVWQHNSGLRFTQAVGTELLPAGEKLHFEDVLPPGTLDDTSAGGMLEFRAEHAINPRVELSFKGELSEDGQH